MDVETRQRKLVRMSIGVDATRFQLFKHEVHATTKNFSYETSGSNVQHSTES
ncbi:hypothetical protein Goarm_018025 [Gossypium armourianum]|uniref:Uncharacterized protein n=2 Tax=Gossypium TaxID=3633 RepID=A0A7J9IGE0_9ROSI|nr:hypothetical protein [Gossypium aridum]MBA0821151.1 hypothetical protein [Gossypium armourianum]